jgi:putative flippase GtrA
MRLVRFFTVGWMGFIVQMAAFVALTSVFHVPWLWATVAAAELSIVHNFFWHERWTWKDRTESRGVSMLAKLARFNVATGIVAVGGNLAVVALCVTIFKLPPVVATVLAVATLSILNFILADRWIFQVAVVAVGLMASPIDAFAGPSQRTIDAWNRYAADAEARFERASGAESSGEARAWGESVDVEAGTIVDWHGVVFIPGVTIEQLLDDLLHPDRAPLQEDVVALRVLERMPDSLRMYLRLVRKTVVTMTYDTEHEMTFCRRTPALLTARSVATSIREAEGGDRGFLWRMNSYWRYRRVDGGVLVEVESLTLSRRVPTLARPIAAPIINRVARESLLRTLETMRNRLKRDSGLRVPGSRVGTQDQEPRTRNPELGTSNPITTL